MNIDSSLRIGDVSDNRQITIVDEDRLCYIVKSESRGSIGLRTISKGKRPNLGPSLIWLR